MVMFGSDGIGLKNLQRTLVAPIQKAVEHNTAELANTDILAAALTPTNAPCLFRVMVCFDAAGILSAMITRGANTQQCRLNNNAALTANALYIFDHLIENGDSVNYQYSVNATLMVLRVQEIDVGAQ